MSGHGAHAMPRPKRSPGRYTKLMRGTAGKAKPSQFDRAQNPPQSVAATSPVGVGHQRPGFSSILPHGVQTEHVAGMDVGQINPHALRMFLISRGYDLPRKGGMDNVLKSALGDFLNPAHVGSALATALSGTHITGKRNPKRWNLRFGTSKTKSKSFLPIPKSLDAHGNSTANQIADRRGSVNLTPAQSANPQMQLLKMALAKYGHMIDPATAQQIAGLQYDAPIQNAQDALATDPRQAAKDLADIGGWYGQATAAEKTAGQRDAAAGAAGISSIQDAAHALAASLGGSANMGASAIGAAGQNAVATEQAMQTAQNQYNSDLAPLLAAEKASQLSQQNVRNENQAAQDRVTLDQLLQKRGQAQTAAADQIQQENNALAQARAGTKLDIAKENAALTQQGFQNALSLAQAQIAAEMNGLKVQQAQAQIAHTQNLAAEDALGVKPFYQLSPTMQNKILTGAGAALKDANGNWLPITPQQAQARLVNALGSYGYRVQPGSYLAKQMQIPLGFWAQGK